MRLIKFRGKRIDYVRYANFLNDNPKLQYVYGDFFRTPVTTENFHAEGGTQFFDAPNDLPNGRFCIRTESGCVYQVLEDSISEFIGVIDINNNEVYENDTVKLTDYDNDQFIGIVKFYNGSFFVENSHISLYNCHSIQVL